MVGIYDLLTLAVAVAGYLLGRHRGFAWQVSGLLTLAGGGLCATVLSRPVGPLFAEGLVGRFVAWVVVYAVVAVCLYVLTLKFKDRIRELEFEELDKRFGGGLGAFKALCVFALVTIVAVAVSGRVEAAVKDSLAGRGLRGVVGELRPLLPERVHEAFGPWLDAVGPEPSPEGADETPTPADPAEGAADGGPTADAGSSPGPTSEEESSPSPEPERSPAPSSPDGSRAGEPFGPPVPSDDEPAEVTPPPPERTPSPAEDRPRHIPTDPWDTSDDPPDPLAPPEDRSD